jgi:hypothetical protein
MAKKNDGGGKKAKPAPKMLKEVKITAKAPKHTEEKSLTRKGPVATRRIDSIKRANPALGRVIGKGSKDRYGNTTYGDDSTDAIRAGLKGSAKKK